MTNIWAQSFEEVRKPFFEMEDPYTLREKKEKAEKEEKPKRWWDDDGDGVGYEKGEVSGKFKKKKVKEEVEEVDEAQEARNNPEKYGREQSKKYAPVRGERTPMPPRGHKSREDFEKWYRANVKEEVETLTEVDKTQQANQKLDVRRGIKNKVVIGPQLKEEIEEWIGELVEEGYDLSKFTLEEIVDIYESTEAEQLDEQMPAQGDSQTVDVTNDRMLSAKRRAAQAQIRADLARVQLQKASVTRESFDSIVEYLSQRPDAFENLEEGVFDPNKSKLRPASERSKTVMTDAQRKAAKKKQQRVSKIHSKGETVLAGMRPSKTKGKVKTTPEAKPEAPKANRKVRGRYDKLASAANKVLKDLQN